MAGRKKRLGHEDKAGSPEARPTSQPPCYDVFISYSSRDREWVRGELLQRIEQAGLRAFIDFRDFTPGAPSIKEIERGIEMCRKTLIVLTPNYLKSEWCELEGVLAQTLDPVNNSLRLIPLLKTPCQKPLRIGALTHIDFTDGAGLDLAWRQLLTALGAHLRPREVKNAQRDDWFLAHPYLMPPGFTGRLSERKMLTNWLNADTGHRLLVLRALGGFGKSSLVWHWLTHDVAPTTWPRVVWWSFYEGDPSFDNFLGRTLEYLSDAETNPRSLNPRRQIDGLVHLLRKPGILLVLDGFERGLRAYGGLNAAYRGDEGVKSEDNQCDCISRLAEDFLRNVVTLPGIRSKVLLTTRLRPHVLEARGGGCVEGCWEEELKQMQPADAVRFFLAQGVRGTHTEIERACEPYGYHPLSLRLLAGLVVGDLQQPGDIAAASRLDVSGDLVARRHHVLEQAYNSITPDRRALLGQIACFRNAVNYSTLKTLAKPDATRIMDADLHDLVARGLLHHDLKANRFDLHPIVRRYVYHDRLTVSDRVEVHGHLRDHFAGLPRPEEMSTVDDLTPVIELYYHTARAGRYEEAWQIYRHRLMKLLFMQFCVYQTCIELLSELRPDASGLPQLTDMTAQGRVLNLLSASCRYLGQPHQAIAVYPGPETVTRQGDVVVTAVRLGNVARSHIAVGRMKLAEKALRNSVRLCHRVGSDTGNTTVARFWESAGHSKWAFLLAARGAYRAAQKHLDRARAILTTAEARYYRFIASAHCALMGGRNEEALKFARQAWPLRNKMGQSQQPYNRERDLIRAEWTLGATLTAGAVHNAHSRSQRLREAENQLHDALERCRRINMVDMEASILVDSARLRIAMHMPEDAMHLAGEALVITERSGYVLQGADAHLVLAHLARVHDNRDAAREHAQRAKELATCDRPPRYTYKAAYNKACALLKRQ